jgi:hypothetical protein
VSVKVDFMPKFSTRGVWQRWRESYASEGKKVEPNITVFSGVCLSCHQLLITLDWFEDCFVISSFTG